MVYQTVIRFIYSSASDKFPVFQINRISLVERKPKDITGQEKSKVVLEKGQE